MINNKRKKLHWIFLSFYVFVNISATKPFLTYGSNYSGLFPLYFDGNFLGNYEKIVVDKSGIVYAANPDCIIPYDMKLDLAYKLMPVFKYYNQNGIEIIVHIKEKVVDSGPFNSGRAKITIDNNPLLVGYIDIDGYWAINPNFFKGTDYKDGYAAVSTGELTWGIIDIKGKWILEPQPDITSVENIGFGLFKFFSKKSPNGTYIFYNVSSKKRLDWVFNAEAICIWNEEPLNYDGNMVLPILIGIRESSESIAYYSVDGKIIFSKLLYPGLKLKYDPIIIEGQLLLFGSMKGEKAIEDKKMRIRYLNIISNKLSPYFDIDYIDYPPPEDTFNYFISYSRDNQYFDSESRSSNYYNIYNYKGELIYNHFFTSVYKINEGVASVSIGLSGIGLFDMNSNKFILEPTQLQLKPIDKSHWFVRNSNEAYTLDIASEKKSYNVPNINILWINERYVIGFPVPVPGVYWGDRSYMDNNVAGPVYGYINIDNLRLRSGPSIHDSIIKKYAKGTRIKLLEVDTAIDTINDQRNVWFKVEVLKWDIEKKEYIVEEKGWFFGAYIDLLGGYQQ